MNIIKKRGKNKRGKKGQAMSMPFILIFSLIIIAVALFVGFWVIRNFLHQAEMANILLFVSENGDLQNEIKNMWSKEAASKTITLPLSKKFDYVCFTNLSPPGYCTRPSQPELSDFCQEVGYWKTSNKDNLFLWPFERAIEYNLNPGWHIKCGQKECLKIDKTLCFEVEGGKVTLKLTKQSGSPYVIISKPSQ